jgi:PAS domain S-box-containing protein
MNDRDQFNDHLSDQSMVSACERQIGEEAFQKAFKNHGAVMYVVDLASFFIVDANEAALKFYGYDRATILTKRIPDLNVTPEAEIRAEVKKAVAENRSFYVYKHQLADGQLRDVEIHANPITILGKDYSFSIVHDITDRLRAEEMLRKSEERHRTILQTAMDGFWLVDAHGRFLEVNESYCRMSGYSEEELLTMSISDVESIESTQQIQERIKEIIKKGSDFFISQHQRKNGTLFDVEVSVQYRLEDGGLFVAFLKDITISRQNEEALRKSEEKFRLSFKTSPDAINLNRLRDGVYAEINEGFSHLMGYSAEEVIGLSSLDLNIWKNENDRMELVKGLSEKGYVDNLEAEFVAKNGDIKIGLMSARIVEMNDEAFTLSITRDITDRKRADAEHQELVDQLHQKNKMEAVGIMAGGIAHNFNNNLSIILGNLELSKRKLTDPPKIRNYIDNAKIAVLRSRDLIKQIMFYSSQSKQCKGPVQLHLLVDETLQLLRATIPATIILQQKLSADSHKITISADWSQLQECLINLCNNATHAMEEKGELTIILERTILTKQDIPIQYDSNPGHYATISVTDTGCGMNQDTMDKIFDLFYTTKPIDQGTGVGLSTVQGIVKGHGGLIKVQSSLGVGTTFELSFPIIDTKEKINEPFGDTKLFIGDERILFIDDNGMLARLGAEMLTEMGYQVTAISDSQEALKKFTANPDYFDLVITDQTMPELTGEELIQHIKRLRPSIPTIICTGYSNKINETEAKDLGASAFLMKPLTLTGLSQMVRQVLDGENE